MAKENPKENSFTNSLIINRGGQNYQIVEPLNITDDGCAYCIKADYYKMGYANFMNHTKDGFKATGIKVTDMENEDIKLKVVGKVKYDSDFGCGARIYDTNGLAPTQKCNMETKIIEYMDNKEQQTEPTIGAIRTRSYKGQPTTLEHNGSTESNAITSVQKDNVVIEPINTTEDGLATTLTTAHHYSGNIVNPKRGQTEMGVVEYKTTEPLNPYNDGTSRTIKGQYQCTSTANLTRGDSLGATGAITFNGRESNNLKIDGNYEQGRIFEECNEANTREVLRLLWKEVGTETFLKEMGGLGRFQETEVLRQNVYEESVCKEGWNNAEVHTCSSYGTETDNIGGEQRNEMRDLRQDNQLGCSSQGQELQQQFIREFNDCLSKLPHETSQTEKCVQYLRQACEGTWLLRETLSTLEEVRKSVNMLSQTSFRIRKLTTREVFRLMDVSEPDIDKLLNAGISNSQLYKLAGNSVVVSCLYHLFRKMFIETDMDYTGRPQQLNLF